MTTRVNTTSSPHQMPSSLIVKLSLAGFATDTPEGADAERAGEQYFKEIAALGAPTAEAPENIDRDPNVLAAQGPLAMAHSGVLLANGAVAGGCDETARALFIYPSRVLANRNNIALIALKRNAFENQLAEAMQKYKKNDQEAGDDSTKKKETLSNYLNVLRGFEAEETMPELATDRISRLFYAYKEVGAFADMVRLYEGSCDPLFKDSDIIREFYIVALNKTGQILKCFSVADSYIAANFKNGEVLAAYGKAYRTRSRTLAKLARAYEDDNQEDIRKFKDELANQTSDVPDNKEAAKLQAKADMEKSLVYYRDGYELEHAYYPGINAAYNLIELGRHEEASRMAQLVYLSTLKDGGRSSRDYWCLATMLELALMGGKLDAAIDLLPRVIHASKESWEIGSTLEQIRAVLLPRFEEGQDRERVEKIITELELRKFNIKLPPEKSNPSLYTKKEFLSAAQDKQAEMIASVGFHYRGCSTHYVPGNIKYNGILHDHVINRRDREAALEVIKTLGLADVTDIDTWDDAVNSYLEQMFHLKDPETKSRWMEYLEGTRHKYFEKTQEGALELTKARETKRSYTNIMVDVSYGLGDCRNVAYAKQLLFDVWKDHHIGSLMQQALQESDPQKFENIKNRIDALIRRQLYVCDVKVSAAIATEGTYNIKYDSNGLPLLAEDRNHLEDHTLNILVDSDPEGNLVRTELRDAFYQVVYGWQRYSVDPSEFVNSVVSGVYSAGNISAVTPDGDSIPVKVYLSPTPYAGQREYVRPGDRGEWLFRGEEIEFDTALVLPRDSSADGGGAQDQRRHWELWDALVAINPYNYDGKVFGSTTDLPQGNLGRYLFNKCTFSDEAALLEVLKRGADLSVGTQVSLAGVRFTEISAEDRAFIIDNIHRLPRDFSYTVMDALFFAELCRNGVSMFAHAAIYGGRVQAGEKLLDARAIDLTDAIIIDVEFYGADFSSANFNGARLNGVRFDNCNISQASFISTTWRQVELINVNLGDAELDAESIEELSLHDVDLKGARLSIDFLLNLPFNVRQTGELNAANAMIIPNDKFSPTGCEDTHKWTFQECIGPYSSGEKPLQDLLVILVAPPEQSNRVINNTLRRVGGILVVFNSLVLNERIRRLRKR